MATQKQTVQEEIAALKARLKELETVELDELDAKEKELEEQLAAVRKRRDEIIPPMEHPAGRAKRGGGPKAAKAAGIQVSDKRLAELIKEAGGVLSIRSRKGSPAYDIDNIKSLVEASNGKFKLAGKSPWPSVVLA